MSLYVLDASVIVKWLIPENPDEHNVAQALALLSALRAGTIVVRQPCHWLAEVAAVGVRLKPDTIADDIADLQELGMVSVAATQPLWNIACSLAIRLNHHLFDTLYHAVALQSDALLITADEEYFRKAEDTGNIRLLSDYQPE
ncbi:MAG: type II toxin-antitoxin system VapC family toxin [Methylococcales bacterium]